MRVIAGEYRGRVLSAPKKTTFRPTSDRVKETLFNILAHNYTIEGAEFCDLFAGSGSIGIEAMSRRASKTSFIENDRTSLAILKKNLETVSPARPYEIVPISVESFLKTVHQQYSILFADPPYAYAKYDELFDAVMNGEFLTPGGVLVIEHAGALTFPQRMRDAMRDQRDLGTTKLSFFSNSAEVTP